MSFIRVFPPDLRQRNRQGEVMDDPHIAPERFTGALSGLRRVNIATATTRLLWPGIAAAAQMKARNHPGRPLRVLDVGSGGGDVAVSLWHRARRAEIDVEIAGCDISPLALSYAADHAARAKADVTFFSHDVLTLPLPSDYDVIMCTLFLHHLPKAAAVSFLANAMRQTRDRVIIQDLVRSPLGYLTAYWGVRLLACNDVCRIDGPRSVEAAFTSIEADELMSAAARQADIPGRYDIAKRFPFRMMMNWERQND